MNTTKINKNYIKNLLLKVILKKGNNITAKNLILDSSINIFKNIKNFYKLFENIIKNEVCPFKIVRNKNKYEYRYSKNNKFISNFIINIINSSRNKNKRISFDFYFKNEINKILENLNNVNSVKKNLTNLYNNINFTPLTVKKKFNEKDIEIIVSKKKKIKIIYKHINLDLNYSSKIVYIGNNKPTTHTENNNLILLNEIENLNFI